MIHIGLFEGIGGFSLAAKMAGWETLATCEINPFGQRVLKHYWPGAYHHGDIKTLTYDTINAELSARYGTDWRKEPVIITGGFPCQPYSLAGKRLGKEDDRHLWPEMLRVIREVSPEWVVGENVFGLVNWNGGLVFDEVQSDLEAAGYEVQPFILPACGVNAPHKRDRVWFVAHRASKLQHGDECRKCNDKRRENVQQEVGKANTIEPTAIGKNGAPTHTHHHGSHGAKNGQSDNQGDDRSPSGAHATVEPSRCSGSAVDTNTSSKQSEWNGLEQCEVSEQEQVEFRRDGCGMDNGNAANPNGERLRRESNGFGKSKFASKNGEGYNWENFPTQSPVCGGNDGIPAGLVGITVSKHRSESIKAYGNAIVPQVVYQIFKVINKMTTNERMD